MFLPVLLLLAQPQEARVAELLAKAAVADVARWAALLMEADAEAVKLERSTPPSCCGIRCIRVQNFELTYRWNEIGRTEIYQHDLLALLAKVHEGRPSGAEALVRLHRSENASSIFGDRWILPFQKIIVMVDSARWRDLRDWRLDRILAEAYETWWSLSLMTRDDNLITVGAFKRTDFREGAEEARRKALVAYEHVIAAGHGDPDMLRRVADIRAGRDTRQRAWIPAVD